MASATAGACDESKCLSTGLWMPTDPDGSTPEMLFNCYAQGPDTLYPYLCADGLEGVQVSFDDTTDLHYYTCCNLDATTTPETLSPPVRECLDPQPFSDQIQTEANASEACQANSPSHPFVRFSLDVPGLPRAYLCCDVDNGTSVSELDPGILPMPPIGDDGIFGIENIAGIEEVTPPPDTINISSGSDNLCMGNLFCKTCTVTNSFGDLEAMNCYHDVFRYPEVVSQDGNTATYQCCTAETGSMYVVDSNAYRTTAWTQFVLALIASCMSSVLIAAVTRSLWRKHRNGNTKSNHHNNKRRQRGAPDYSAYNLYLVFLAIPDLLYNAFMLGIVSDVYMNGWFPPSDFLLTFCAMSNQYLNVIIAREILVLLQRTKNIQRYSPPSLKKAGIQFGVTASFAAVVATFWYLLLHRWDDWFASGTYGDTATNSKTRRTEDIPWREFTIPVFYVLVVALPACYLSWVCFAIWHQKLLPKNHIGRRRTTTQQLIKNPSSSTTNPRRSTARWSLFRSKASARTVSTGASSANQNNNITDNTTASVTTRGTGTTTSSQSQSQSQSTSHKTLTSTTTSATTTTTVVQTGRLNVLAVYFARIILVFFFIWLPGMIMYYVAYQPNRNTSPLLHNIGLMFLSLQAIVSCGMAMTKPDVIQAIGELYSVSLGRLVSACSCCSCSKMQAADASPPSHTADVEAAAPKEGDVVTARHDTVGDPISTITAGTTSIVSTVGGPSHMEIMPVTVEEDEYEDENENENESTS
mmetsp:Transcript_20258/g.47471  ORF Transcript_20258/g.47471 Transcript_20258/m.47471 type:complete len:753 (-) Transcript_20258:1456-3714(-)